MYCQNCGNVVNPTLSYCNHCGSRLGGKQGENNVKLPLSTFNFLIAALIGVPIAGLGVIIALLSVMKRGLQFGDDMIGLVMIMSFFLLLVSELGLIWLLWSNSARTPKVGERKETEALSPAADVVIKGLPESRIEPISSVPPSVTDETTRALDAIPRK